MALKSGCSLEKISPIVSVSESRSHRQVLSPATGKNICFHECRAALTERKYSIMFSRDMSSATPLEYLNHVTDIYTVMHSYCIYCVCICVCVCVGVWILAENI